MTVSPTATAAGIDIREVVFGYTRSQDVLRGASLRVEPGESIALLGPNGCGKSTLLQLISGLLRPRTGSVSVHGRAAAAIPRVEMARALAVVPQTEEALFPFTALEVVTMGRYAHRPFGVGGDSREDLEAAAAALDRVGMSSLAARPLQSMSGGQRQLILIARALAQDSPILLLDEPTHSLDPRYQKQILELLRTLNRDEGKTVLWVTHDLGLAAEFAPRVAVLEAGRIAADGPPADVMTAELLTRLYGTAIARQDWADGRGFFAGVRAS